MLALSATCYVLALGPSLHVGQWTLPLPYLLLMKIVPGFASMRGPTRFGFGFMLGFAALAAFGLETILVSVGSLRYRRIISCVVLAAALLITTYEYNLFDPRIGVREVRVGTRVPELYQAVRQASPAPLLEIPGGGLPGDLQALVDESEYMFYSTFHWRPLLNGYSGYAPPSYQAVMGLARSLPDAKATQILARATGVRHVAVHLSRLSAFQQRRWIFPPGLKLIGAFGTDRLYEVADPPDADLSPALLDFTPRATTLLGHPLTPLPEPARRAGLTLATPPPHQVVTGQVLELDMIVTNLSQVTWPALVSVGDHIVTFAYFWEDEAGGRLQSSPEIRLPYDLAGGESVHVPVRVLAPDRPGPSRLVLTVTQDGEVFPQPLRVEPITILPIDVLRSAS